MRGYAFGLIGATVAAVAAVTLAAVGSIQRLSDPTDAVRAAAHLQAAHQAVRKAYAAEAVDSRALLEDASRQLDAAGGLLAGAEAVDSRALLEDASRQLDAAGGLLAGAEVVQAAVSRAVAVSVVAAALLALLAGAVLWSGSFRWVITPLSNLAERMQRLTEDPSPIDLPARGPREVRALQRTFNRLVTALHGYRERITQMERANIGRILAHQFRNSLTPIRLGADELTQEPPVSALPPIAAMLHEAAARMEAILDRFGALYRFPEPVRADLDLALLVRRLAPGYPTVQVEAPAAPVPVHADRTLLEQALANLIQNAVDAAAGSGSGPVRVVVSERPAAIAVHDHGCGMTPEQQQRAFDDYYTTKANGMGVGLSFVRKVAAAHDIRVRLRSQAGQGTTVSLAFPGTGVA